MMRVRFLIQTLRCAKTDHGGSLELQAGRQMLADSQKDEKIGRPLLTYFFGVIEFVFVVLTETTIQWNFPGQSSSNARQFGQVLPLLLILIPLKNLIDTVRDSAWDPESGALKMDPCCCCPC